MSRTATITDEQILDAARALFIEEGFGVATAKIARRAGVSEGTIFKRFQTKDELFTAALQVQYPPAWYHLAKELAGSGDAQKNLGTVVEALFDFIMESIPRIVALLGNPLPQKPPESMHELRQRDEAVLREYFLTEMKQGRLRVSDLDTLIHTLFGFLTSHSFEARMSGVTLSAEKRHALAEKMVALLWEGIAPNKA